MSALLSARVKGLISLSLNTVVSFSLFTPEKMLKSIITSFIIQKRTLISLIGSAGNKYTRTTHVNCDCTGKIRTYSLYIVTYNYLQCYIIVKIYNFWVIQRNYILNFQLFNSTQVVNLLIKVLFWNSSHLVSLNQKQNVNFATSKFHKD